METKIIGYDTEVFEYDFLVVFVDEETGIATRIHNDGYAIEEYIENHRDYIFAGFNNKHYDKFVTSAMVKDNNPFVVKDVNDLIIQGGNGWDYSHKDSISYQFDQLDIMDDMQVGLSLKAIQGHMFQNIVESEVDFNLDRELTPEEIEETFKYCENDVRSMLEVVKLRKDYLETKIYIGSLSGLGEKESLSLTNAKLTSKFLKAKPKKYNDERDYVYPSNLLWEYIPKEVKEFFDRLHDKTIDNVFDKQLKIDLGDGEITLGFGGIHSAIPNYIEEADDNREIVNVDVASYYPHLITIEGYASRCMSNPKEYEEMLEQRMKAKKEGNKKLANALKLIANTTYGATLNQYNDLYDPKMARSVCITGQLRLLELANHLKTKCKSVKIVQLNTDGIMISIDKSDKQLYKEIIDEWQKRTGFELEEDNIKKIIQKDVSNYIEVQLDGSTKIKGITLVRGIAPAGAFNINNNMPIVSKAIIDYFVKGVSIEETINNCNSIKEFQLIAKASSKYHTVVWNCGDRQVEVQRCNRVYASKHKEHGILEKVKQVKGEDRFEKIASLPEHCVIDNDNHLTIEEVDKGWYIKMAKKYLGMFLGVEAKKKELKKEKKELKSKLKEILNEI